MIIYSAASSALEGVQNLPLSLAFTLSENTHTRLHYRELAQTVKKHTETHTHTHKGPGFLHVQDQKSQIQSPPPKKNPGKQTETRGGLTTSTEHQQQQHSSHFTSHLLTTHTHVKPGTPAVFVHALPSVWLSCMREKPPLTFHIQAILISTQTMVDCLFFVSPKNAAHRVRFRRL